MAERALSVVTPTTPNEGRRAMPAITPASLPELLQLGDMLIKSGLMPPSIKTAEAAFAVMLKGMELGVPAMAAIEGITIIQGKPSCSPHLMLALIRRDYGSGAIRVKESTAERCVVEWRQPGWDGTQTYTFTIEDAKQAELLGNQTWKKYPAAMCRARCISAVAKMAFPEVVGGMYIHGELGGDVVVRDDGDIEPVASSPTAEVIDAETGEIVPEQEEVAYDNTTRRMRALHAAGKDKGLDHQALHDLAVAGYRVRSLSEMTAPQLDDFMVRVGDRSAEALAAAVAKARGAAVAKARGATPTPPPEPEPGPEAPAAEPAAEPAAIDDREKRLIEVRELIEGGALRDDHEWATFGEEIGGDAEAWLAAVGATITAGQLTRLGNEARRRGAWSPGFERAYGERATALRERDNGRGQ